jgi:hypothetical protein
VNERGETWTYEVASDDRIVAVSDNWDGFAMENDGEDACARYVLGRPWMDFIVGQEATLLWTALVMKVRQTGLPGAVPIRCDGPSVRRFMRVRLLPRPDNSIRFCSELIREEPRDYCSLLDRECRRGDSFIRICGWCARVDVDNEWVNLEDAIQSMRLFERNELPALSHGVCHECLERLIQQEPGA